MNLIDNYNKQQTIQVQFTNHRTGETIGQQSIDIGNSRGLLIFSIDMDYANTAAIYEQLLSELQNVIRELNESQEPIFSIVLPDSITVQYIRL